MDALILVHEDEAAHLAQSPRAMAELLDGQRRFAQRCVDHGRLRPNGGRELAQFYWLQVDAFADAVELARELPVLDSDEIEVRPVMSGVRAAIARRGPVFGFVVRGSALSEAGWTSVMDRIDTETRDELRSAPLVSGVRLQLGRRIERRAVMDGPFLEGKEVIGGLFFLRMPSLIDAQEWAARSRYVVHGSLEVRQLWR
ncbi:MAG: YciI family protein [Kofleriaceae bacterium]